MDAAWRRLLDRAGPRDLPPLTDDPDLHLLVDGARVDAEQRQRSVYVFRLPPSPGSVVIASREVVPAEFGIARDPRSLGVALRQLTIRQGADVTMLEAEDERLTVGFHEYEPADGLRWTNGYAELPAAAFARLDQSAELTLHLGVRHSIRMRTRTRPERRHRANARDEPSPTRDTEPLRRKVAAIDQFKPGTSLQHEAPRDQLFRRDRWINQQHQRAAGMAKLLPVRTYRGEAFARPPGLLRRTEEGERAPGVELWI